MNRVTPATAPRRSRPPLRARTWALIALGASLVAAAGSWLWAGDLANRRLRAAIAEADRRGPDWRLGDLLASREAIPPDENSASRVARIVGMMPRSWPYLKPGTPPPPPGSSWPAGFADMSRFDGIDDLPPNERPDLAWAADIRRNLRILEPAVIEARVLAGMDRGRIDVPLARLAYLTLLNPMQEARGVARLIELDAMLRAHDGDPDGALESCRALVACGRSMGDDIFLIAQLVRMAIVRRGLKMAERTLAQGEPSDAALARFQALLIREADAPSPLLRGMLGERALAHDVLGGLASGQHTPAEVLQAISVGTGGVNRTAQALATVSRSYVVFNHALTIESLNRAVEIARRPIAEQAALWDRWEASHARPEGLLPQLATQIHAEASQVSLVTAARSYLGYQAQLRAMIAAVAAERHRRRHGAFPERLGAIDGDLLAAATTDPFTGAPLLLRREARGIAIYSVGPDRRDDRGAALNLKNLHRPGQDLGYRLYVPADRARPPREDTLPDDVFQATAEGRDDGAGPGPEDEPVGP